MNLDIINDRESGPAVHIGVPLILAYFFRLNPVVAVLCGMLPDLVDKPLHVLEIGGGRYIGHTLLFVGLVSLAFFIWRRKYGLAALLGGMSHLVLDMHALVPWFYPFKDYNFNEGGLNVRDIFSNYLSSTAIIIDVAIVAVVGLAGFVSWWVYRKYGRRKKNL